MEDFFRSRDRDFDGYLSFEEFLGEESKLEKLFKKMDTNNDGKVSKQVNFAEQWKSENDKPLLNLIKCSLILNQ